MCVFVLLHKYNINGGVHRCTYIKYLWKKEVADCEHSCRSVHAVHLFGMRNIFHYLIISLCQSFIKPSLNKIMFTEWETSRRWDFYRFHSLNVPEGNLSDWTNLDAYAVSSKMAFTSFFSLHHHLRYHILSWTKDIETANFEGLQQRKIIQAALVKVLLLVLKIFAQTRNKNQY